MFRQKHKKLLRRVSNLLFALTIIAFGLGFWLKADDTVFVWTMLIGMVSWGGGCFVSTLGFLGKEAANRWYRAANLAALILYLLMGVLAIGAAVAWGIAGLTLGQFPVVSWVLLTTAMAAGLVGILVIGGLGATGWMVQSEEETLQRIRSRGR